MPRQTDRREVLSEAVIYVLAHEGIHGLTHRAVDARAQAPVGTTSRYFRTRAALILVAAETVRDRHRAYMEQLAATSDQARGDLVSALARIITDAEEANRDLYIARFELGLESLRSPELGPIMEEMRVVSISTARGLAHSVGIELSADQTDVLGSLLVGVTLDLIILGRPRFHTDAVAESLARAITPSSARPEG